MTFNISQFSAEINKRGLAKNNMFLVTITIPPNLGFLAEEMPSRDLQFLCKTTSLPAIEISTSPIKMQGWGKIENRPQEFTRTNLPLVFMVDSQFATLRFFHRWIQSIVNYNDLGGENSEDPQGKLPYEFDYKHNYITSVQIDVFSENMAELKYTYKFGGAYPVTIGQIELGWENAAEIMSLSVGFAYDSTAVESMAQTSPSDREAWSTHQERVFGSLDTRNIPSQLSSLSTQIQDTVNRLTSPLQTAINKFRF